MSTEQVSGRGSGADSAEAHVPSETYLGLLPQAKSEIKLREGNKTDPIPSPCTSEQSLYNLILERDDFKTHCTYVCNEILASSMLRV